MSKRREIKYFIAFIALLLSPVVACARFQLTISAESGYQIIVPVKASLVERHAAAVLQTYLLKILGSMPPVITDSAPPSENEIRIGRTNRGSALPYSKLNADGIFIGISGRQVTLTGGTGKGVLYSVYTFLENYLGCRKFTQGPAIVPKTATIALPEHARLIQNPVLDFRGVYYPQSADQEYLDWHKLNRREESWGLWVHTFDKLVPSTQFFKEHPEYYALVDGKRQPTQLCLSNPAVLRILTANLRSRIADDPGKLYWSVSQNDGLGYCECDKCRAIDEREGGPQGSILNFVNKVAAQFPNQVISTLAYTYSRRAPLTIKPRANVHIMFSSIECNRGEPIATDPRSGNFRKDLHDWSLLTKNLFVWDYVVQFTNYDSPFPNLRVLQPNVQLFVKYGVKGLFEQGSGDAEGEFSELRAYLLAKLAWDPDSDLKMITAEFMHAWYGAAAPFIDQYINLLHNSAKNSGRVIDIYGTPAKEFNSYLTPELINKYGEYFDLAEAAVESSPVLLARVSAVRLPVEYAVLQQSKFYGIEKHGAFTKNDNGDWVVRPGLAARVKRFTDACKLADITTLSEEPLPPDEYLQEWTAVIKLGPKIHAAIGAGVTALTPFSREYPNKGLRTLTDGSRGYSDFQYNWLGWYGNDMAVVVDIGKQTEIKKIGLSFLEDQRHWAFAPETVSIEVSADNAKFYPAGILKNEAPLENYSVSIHDNILIPSQPVTARYIKITAVNLKTLPPWRNFKNRQAWIFADEVMVN